MDDNLLVENIISGNDRAFKELVTKYQTLVLNTCFGFLHNSDDAQDVAQEVFIEVHRSLKKFRKESKLSTWMYRISVNKSLNYIRDNKKRKWLQSLDILFESEKNILNQNPVNESPQDVLEHEERNEMIKNAIDSLPNNQKTAFVLLKYENLSYQEISGVMNISLSSVESLLFRAKKNLQKRLINYYKKG